jgi:hypothetical protein
VLGFCGANNTLLYAVFYSGLTAPIPVSFRRLLVSALVTHQEYGGSPGNRTPLNGFGDRYITNIRATHKLLQLIGDTEGNLTLIRLLDREVH